MDAYIQERADNKGKVVDGWPVDCPTSESDHIEEFKMVADQEQSEEVEELDMDNLKMFGIKSPFLGK